MKSLLVFTCLPLLFYCQSRDYFFVPTMRAYNRMLCQSGLPGTESPLVCPQNEFPLQYAPSLYPALNQYSPQRNPMISVGPPVNRQQRTAQNEPYLVPFVPMRTQNREEPTPHLLEGRPKKVYLIPWESKGEKPLINFILVPDELLSPNAPLDTLDDERRLELKITRYRRPKSEHGHHIRHIGREPISNPKSKFTHSHQRSVKEFRTVHSGEDGQDYDDSAIE